jgi:hypothetical protein
MIEERVDKLELLLLLVLKTLGVSPCDKLGHNFQTWGYRGKDRMPVKGCSWCGRLKDKKEE